jgi:hypothetical protein
MNRTHVVFYRNSAGANCSFHAPDAPDCVPVGDALKPMRPAREAHLERMRGQGDSIPDAGPSPARFNRNGFADLESSFVEQLTIQVPAYGRIHQVPAYGHIHQAIPA